MTAAPPRHGGMDGTRECCSANGARCLKDTTITGFEGGRYNARSFYSIDVFLKYLICAAMLALTFRFGWRSAMLVPPST